MNNEEQPQSITLLFQQLREGDPDSANRLWERFFDKLVAYASSQMEHANRRVSDEEDIACGVMTALCARADQCRLPTISNREDLWHILLSWTRHDVIDHVRRDKRQKRGGGNVRGDSYYDSPLRSWSEALDSSPAPDLIAEMQEQYEGLLELLPNTVLREIAIDKMCGLTNGQIAAKLELTPRSIERKLALIRRHWSERIPSSE